MQALCLYDDFFRIRKRLHFVEGLFAVYSRSGKEALRPFSGGKKNKRYVDQTAVALKRVNTTRRGQIFSISFCKPMLKLSLCGAIGYDCTGLFCSGLYGGTPARSTSLSSLIVLTINHICNKQSLVSNLNVRCLLPILGFAEDSEHEWLSYLHRSPEPLGPGEGRGEVL